MMWPNNPVKQQSNNTKRANYRGGFTLLEILIAIMILAVIGVMAYRGLDGVRQTTEHISKITKRWQQLSHTFGRLERDLRLSYNVVGKGTNGENIAAWMGGSVSANWGEHPTLVAFLRLGGDENESFRVGYRLHEKNLEILVWPYGDDFGRSAPIGTYKLMEDVKDIKFSFMNDNGNYLDNWPENDLSKIPRAVKIIITIDEGSVERIFDLH